MDDEPPFPNTPARAATRPQRRSLLARLACVHVNLAVTLLCIGAIILAGASVRWVQLRRSWRLVTVDVAQLEAGQRPASDWVDLRGRLLYEFAAEVPTPSVDRIYIPVVSKNWRPGMPVAVYLMVPETEMLHLLHFPDSGHVGLIRRQGLPLGLAPDLQQTMLRHRTPHYVVAYGTSPESRFSVAMNLTILGIVITCLSAFAALVEWRRRPGKKREVPEWTREAGAEPPNAPPPARDEAA